MMRFRPTAAWLLLPLFALAGCGKTETGPPPVTAQQALTEVGGMYKEYTKDHKRPPQKLSDFDHPYEAAAIDGYAALRDGTCVMLWGGSLPGASAAATVLAYEKDVPTAGGQVLFQDGTVRGVTADEFKAAPKAGKPAGG
jgi:hypothetical protein